MAVGRSRKARSRVSAEHVARMVESVRMLRKLGIATLLEAAVFCEAASSQDATLGAIARTIGLPFSSVSRAAFELEQRGLVRYEPHPTDRRKKIVRAGTE
jgi:DNA-binding MarR family transcriptional regulator